MLDRTIAGDALWLPVSGPQLAAYLCEADELFYGGAAGGGKSDLLLGLALTSHLKSIVFRREFPQLRDLVLRSHEILAGTGATYNASSGVWRGIPGGRMLEFASCGYDKDLSKYKGRPHDGVFFDEVADFNEYQYRFLTAWARTTVEGQRVRVVAAGNPPTTAEGRWVVEYWGPWLDEKYSNPAEPGELRWFARVGDEDVEVGSGEPFSHNGEMVQPRSRTFIPARLSDNPYLADTGYGAVLQGLPEPLRSQLLFGDFTIGTTDDPWQVIPTEWVRQAMARSRERPKDEEGKPVPLSALGVDVARGGGDRTAIVSRYDNWFGEVKRYPGSETPDGPSVATLVVKEMGGDTGAQVNVDIIGVGGSVYDVLKSQGVKAKGINFAEGTTARDKTGRFRFRNVRAKCYWKFREVLDPASGDDVSLPDDPELLADLTAARWSLTVGGILVEAKEDIVKRLRRSPDVGDAVVLASIPRRTLLL